MGACRSTSIAGVSILGFELVEVIHQSGPRVIYRARREADGEEVILKTLLDQYPLKQDVAKIRREFQIESRLSIDGVIRVHSLVSYGSGNLAIETESFGLSLADFMAQRNRKPLLQPGDAAGTSRWRQLHDE